MTVLKAAIVYQDPTENPQDARATTLELEKVVSAFVGPVYQVFVEETEDSYVSHWFNHSVIHNFTLTTPKEEQEALDQVKAGLGF